MYRHGDEEVRLKKFRILTENIVHKMREKPGKVYIPAVFKSMGQRARSRRKLESAADKAALKILLFAAAIAQGAAVGQGQAAATADEPLNGFQILHAGGAQRISVGARQIRAAAKANARE